jgi:hypothetical protein
LTFREALDQLLKCFESSACRFGIALGRILTTDEVEQGFLVIESNNDDGRKKYVTPSKTASKYIGFMSDCLTKAAK